MLKWLGKLFGRTPRRKRDRSERPPRRPKQELHAAYDAAQTTEANRKHWKNADDASARSSADPLTRATLRRRSRYELVENDGYGKGAVESLANDTVGGNGPWLQILTDNEPAANQIQDAFADWAWTICLAEKLRTMRKAKTVDGESFGLLFTNPMVAHSVQLDLRVIEGDQVATPFWGAEVESAVDGIEFDSYGNPVAYHLLKNHPGDTWSWNLDYDRIPARSMLHYYRVDRPGQVRGIPEFASALPFFALLRRFSLATLFSAEFAAAQAGVIESQGPVDIDATDDEDDFTGVDIVHGMLTKMPAGWRMNHMKPEHPATTFEMFETRILMRIGRCVGMPLNVLSGSSQRFNFSSTKADMNNYRATIKVDRAHAERVTLDRIFLAWMDEAIDVLGLLPPGYTSANTRWKWGWPTVGGFIDPLKERQATTEGLQNGTLTLAEAEAEEGTGIDWREKIRQRGRELRACQEEGVPPPGGEKKAVPAGQQQPADTNAADGTGDTSNAN